MSLSQNTYEQRFEPPGSINTTSQNVAIILKEVITTKKS
jgi:hypothetical protein